MRFIDDSDPDTGNSGRPLRLRGGGPPLVAELDDEGKFDAEFDVKAWLHYGGVWYDMHVWVPQSNVGDVLTYPADDACSPC